MEDIEKLDKIDEIVETAKEKAKMNLKDIISEKMLGYNVCLNLETKKILKEEYNIDWEPKLGDAPTESID